MDENRDYLVSLFQEYPELAVDYGGRLVGNASAEFRDYMASLIVDTLEYDLDLPNSYYVADDSLRVLSDIGRVTGPMSNLIEYGTIALDAKSSENPVRTIVVGLGKASIESAALTAGTMMGGPLVGLGFVLAVGESRYSTNLPVFLYDSAPGIPGEVRDYYAEEHLRWEEYLKDYLVSNSGIGHCFPRGTLIRMSDGRTLGRVDKVWHPNPCCG